MTRAIDRNSPCSIVDPKTPVFPNRGLLVGAVTLARSAAAAPSAPIVAAICAAEILGLAGFSIIPALLPQFIDAWSLTNTQAGWLAEIVSAGYMLAVIPLVSLTDRRPARQLYLASSALSALSCFGMRRLPPSVPIGIADRLGGELKHARPVAEIAVRQFAFIRFRERRQIRRHVPDGVRSHSRRAL